MATLDPRVNPLHQQWPEPAFTTTGAWSACDGHLCVSEDMQVRGRFDYDPESDERLPLVVIDGRPYTWQSFGAILSSMEGRQFRLDIVDPTEEV